MTLARTNTYSALAAYEAARIERERLYDLLEALEKAGDKEAGEAVSNAASRATDLLEAAEDRALQAQPATLAEVLALVKFAAHVIDWRYHSGILRDEEYPVSETLRTLSNKYAQLMQRERETAIPI